MGAPVNDEYDVVRVDLNSHGDADIYLASAKYPSLTLIDHIDSAVTASDIAYAILMIQNVGSDTTATLKVDYMNAEVQHTLAHVNLDCQQGLPRPSTYAIGEFLRERNPADVRAYQGGEGQQNGQFAVELLPATRDRGAVIATSEIDLLLSGTSTQELWEIDWKSGYRPWTSDDVKSAFQFRMHNWLVMNTFPELEQLHVTVWQTRFNRRTPRVTFTRKAAMNFQGCVEMAWRARDKVFRYVASHDDKEPWPDEFTWVGDHCDFCPAYKACPRIKAAKIAGGNLRDDPAEAVKDWVALKTAAGRLHALLRKYVDDNGEIQGEINFGTKGPSPVRKAVASTYKAYTPADNGNDDSDANTES